MTDQVLRIGILVDSPIASVYLHDIVQWAQSQSNIRVDHLIVHSPPASGTSHTPPPSKGLLGRLARAMFNAVARMERKRLKRDGRFPRHGQTMDLRGVLKSVLELSPIVSPSGVVYRFTADDVERVRALGLDVLIRGGGGMLRGDILSAARLGVVSFHHADNRINRGMPAAFWEVFHREDATGFTLQRLTEELDGGDVLMRGQFPTRHYYLLNQAALYEKSNYHLKVLLTRIARTGDLPPTIAPIPYAGKLFRAPRASQTLAYVLRLVQSSLRKRLDRIRGKEYRWQVSYVRSGWSHAVLWRGTTISNPVGRYLADPFVIERDGLSFCFVEDFDCNSKRGHISAYELGNRDATFLAAVIKEPFHMSFPYLFEYEGDLFMCPETSEKNEIRIYRCTDFPLKWQLEKTIMSNVRAADTMLFERDGFWWMLTNIDPSGIGDYCSELFVFRSRSPLSTDWEPHDGNPVIVDSARARNAGLIRDGEKIYRVSQKQGFDQYGKGSQVNEILTLTTNAYEEVCVAAIEPNFQDGIIGTHHLHCTKTTTVFDSLKLSNIAKSR